MNIFSWRRSMLLSIGTLILLIVLNFYGAYTNKFYFLKPDNYIFPILAIAHFIYIYVVQFKISVCEYPDPQMRNLEYSLYIIFLVYVFKVFDSLSTLLSYNDYDGHVLPNAFIPMSGLILGLYLLLIFLTLISFKHRKELVGEYNFEELNGKIDSWE